MPSVFIPTPPFPSVPSLPGVPQLARPSLGAVLTAAPNIISALFPPAMAGVLWHATKAPAVWGVFDSTGAQVISPDSIMSLHYRAEWRTSDFPVQQGQFASYNKVKVPYEIPIRMVKGSTAAARVQFQKDINFVAESLDLYTVITPEQTYVGVNPLRVEYMRRDVQYANYVEADVFFREIQEVSPQYSSTATAANTSNAQNPAAVPTQNSGLVQPQPTIPGVQKILDLQSPLWHSIFPNPLGGG